MGTYRRVWQRRTLTPPEEAKLVRCYRAARDVVQGKLPSSDEDDRCATVHAGQCAAARLVLAYLPVIQSWARRRAGRTSVPREDLVQEGVVGLLTAIERFDPQPGARLAPYASWWIYQCIMRAIAYHSRVIRLSPEIRDQFRLIRKTRERLSLGLGHAPTEDEMARELGWEISELTWIQPILRDVQSLDARYGTKRARRLHTLEARSTGTPLASLERIELMDLLARALGTLTKELYREILVHRYGLFGRRPKTLQWLGHKLGLSRERVRQLENKALEKIARSKLGKELKPYAEELGFLRYARNKHATQRNLKHRPRKPR